MNDLFAAVDMSLLSSNVVVLLIAFISVALLFVGYRYISHVLSWNRMIDRRNKDMGSEGWKYGKKGFWN